MIWGLPQDRILLLVSRALLLLGLFVWGTGLKSRESYWHLAGSVCIDAMRTATDRVLLLESYCQVQFSFVHLTKLLPGRLPGPPTYWTVCLSGWSHEILLARAGLCQEGSFLAEAWCPVPGGRSTSFPASRLFSQSGLCLILEVREKFFLFLKHSSFIKWKEICFLLKHSPFIKWQCPSRHLLLVSN